MDTVVRPPVEPAAPPGVRPSPWRETAARAGLELLATAVLLFVVGGAVRWLVGTLPAHGGSGWDSLDGRLWGVAGVVFLTMAGLLYSPIGRRTGAHANPAVSLAEWLLGRTPGRDVLPFAAAQLIGSLLGTALAAATWPALRNAPLNDAAVGLAPGCSTATAFGVEAATLFVIVLATELLATGRRAALLLPPGIAALIALQLGLFAPLTGGSANPARQFGPALLSGATPTLWLYLLAPVLGAVLAALPLKAARTLGRNRSSRLPVR